MDRLYGLIGKKLSHSFSKDYFTSKFKKEEIIGCEYGLFELTDISELKNLIKNPAICGLNVTIPFKKEVIPLLTDLDDSALKVGAVNAIKFTENGLIGYNSDYFGFRQSLMDWIGVDKSNISKSLVLGTGGASQAILAALNDLDIDTQLVSRTSGREAIEYSDINKDTLDEFSLIINTTPLGMYPDINSKPALPYHLMTESNWLYDLVYNPEITSFMRFGQENGTHSKNGLEMLHLQAEKSWEIWSS